MRDAVAKNEKWINLLVNSGYLLFTPSITLAYVG